MRNDNEKLLEAVGPQPANMAILDIFQSSKPISSQFTRSLQGERFDCKLVRQMGVTQLGMGGVALLLNVAGLVLYAALFEDHDCWSCEGTPYKVAPGVWGIVFFGLSGGFTLRAAKQKTACNIVTTMVMSFFSLASAVIIVGVGCWAMANDTKRMRRVAQAYDFSHHERYNDNHLKIAEAFCGVVLSFIFLTVGFAQVVTCCRTVVICARVLRCVHVAPQPGRIAQYRHSRMQVVDNEGQRVHGVRIIQVPGSSDTQQLLATPASVLDYNPHNTSNGVVLSHVL